MRKKRTFKRTELSLLVQPTKSGSNLPAQNTKLCVASVSDESRLYAFIMQFVHDKRLPIQIRLLIDLLLSSGCRISELLDKQGFIVRLNGMCEIYQSKNKQNFTFRSANFNSYLMQFAGSRYTGLTIYSRFQIYRIFKKLGIYAKFGELENLSVCHLPRHLVGSLTYDSTNDLNEVKIALKHKSLNTSTHYVKKVKK